MNNEKQLEYLFVCHFHDKSCIRQTQNDRSIIDPSRSAFFDVSQRIAEVSRFQLCNGKMSYTVKPNSGEFIVNGATLFVDDSSAGYFPTVTTGSPPVIQRELVYFRRVLKITSAEGEMITTNNYHLGWRYLNCETPKEYIIIIPGSMAIYS